MTGLGVSLIPTSSICRPWVLPHRCLGLSTSDGFYHNLSSTPYDTNATWKSTACRIGANGNLSVAPERLGGIAGTIGIKAHRRGRRTVMLKEILPYV